MRRINAYSPILSHSGSTHLLQYALHPICLSFNELKNHALKWNIRKHVASCWMILTCLLNSMTYNNNQMCCVCLHTNSTNFHKHTIEFRLINSNECDHLNFSHLILFCLLILYGSLFLPFSELSFFLYRKINIHS